MKRGQHMSQETETTHPSLEHPQPNDAPTAEEVARRAYELYEARGSEPGADLDDWLQAEHELRTAQNGNARQPA